MMTDLGLGLFQPREHPPPPPKSEEEKKEKYGLKKNS